MNITILNETLSMDDLEGRIIAIVDSHNLNDIDYVNSLKSTNNYVKEIAGKFYKEFNNLDELLSKTDLLITYGDSEVIVRAINLAKSKHIKVISDVKPNTGFKPIKPKVNITIGTIWDKPEPNVTMVYIGRQGKPLPEYMVNANLGNPFTVEEYGRTTAIRLYKVLIECNHDNIQERIKSLLNYGTNIKLCCFCKDKLCHGQVIKEFLENFSS